MDVGVDSMHSVPIVALLSLLGSMQAATRSPCSAAELQQSVIHGTGKLSAVGCAGTVVWCQGDEEVDAVLHLQLASSDCTTFRGSTVQGAWLG